MSEYESHNLQYNQLYIRFPRSAGDVTFPLAIIAYSRDSVTVISDLSMMEPERHQISHTVVIRICLLSLLFDYCMVASFYNYIQAL